MGAKIISIYNQKGGCAKTMTSMQLGGAMAIRGLRVLIVDMDRQGTSVIWASTATPEMPFPAEVISLAPAKENMIGEVKKKFDAYDIIIIDCPPAIESSIPWAALNISDIALIPVSPVLDNVWASKEAREIYLRAKENNSTLRAFYLPSIVTRGRVFDHCKKLLEDDPDVPMLNSQVSRRNAFAESQVFGTVVGLLDKKSAASQEIEKLTNEVLALIELSAKGLPVRRTQKKGGK
jgi:chromosome partitioning protein